LARILLNPPFMRLIPTTRIFSFLILGLLIHPIGLEASLPNKVLLFKTPLPPLETLEEVAFKWAGLDPRQIQSWEKRSRWAAALPDLQVGWESNFLNQNTTIIQDSISVTSSGVTIGPESNRLNADIKSDQDFEVRAIWSLNELIFNRDQLNISREARDLLFIRARLREELHRAYFDLKSLILATKNEPHSLKDHHMTLRIEQAVAQLNGITGGKFQRLWEQNAISLKTTKKTR